MFFGFLVGILLCTSRPLSCFPDRVGWQARSWGEETKIARLCSSARPVASLSTPTSSKKISCMKEGIFSLHHEFCGCFFITFLQIANYEVVNRADFLISPFVFFFRWLSRMRIEHFCENVFITTSLQSEGVSVKMKKM